MLLSAVIIAMRQSKGSVCLYHRNNDQARCVRGVEKNDKLTYLESNSLFRVIFSLLLKASIRKSLLSLHHNSTNVRHQFYLYV